MTSNYVSLIAPQNSSLVVVFESEHYVQIPEVAIAEIVGSEPAGTAQLGDLGSAFAWADGLEITSRQQAPNLCRLEVKQNIPAEIEHSRFKPIMSGLMREAGDLKFDSVGVNSMVTILDSAGVQNPVFAKLVDQDIAGKITGRQRTNIDGAKLSIKSLSGTLKISITLGQMVGQGRMTGLAVNFNHSTPIDESMTIEAALDDGRLTKISRLMGQTVKRIGVGNIAS